MKKLYLVDVSSMFFRAFYAVRPLTAPSGLPTNAIYGVLSMTLKLIKEEKPDYLVFCYDRKEPSFRKEMYDDYKAHRTEMPEDLGPQIPYIKKLADVLGIPSLEVPSFEADDLIGSLAHFGRLHNMEVFIVSGDKDFGQLITEHVWLYDTMKNVKYDTQGVIEKWGVPPRQFIDYLALVGDASDNIPGVGGIGPKGAQKLLQDFDTLEGIYKNLDQIKSASIREKLEKDKDNAFLSKKLVTIVTDVKLSDDPQDYHRKPFLQKELRELLLELDFKNVEKTIWNLDLTAPAMGTPVAEAVAAVSTAVPAAEVADAAKLATKKEVPLDIEVTEISADDQGKQLPKDAEVWIFQTAQGLFLAHEASAGMKLFRWADDAEKLGALSDQKNWKWKGFDLKAFWHLIKPQNAPLIAWDAQLAAYIIKPGDSMEWDRVVSRMTGELPAELPTPQDVLSLHLQLEKSLREQLEKVHSIKILEELDLPLAPILYMMEKRGICLDREILAEQSLGLTKDIQRLEKQIQEYAGEPFNVASPKQLAQVMFEKLKLPPSKKTKTGFSTDNDVLEKLRSQHPIAKLVLEYRELAKLKSTYVDSLPQLVKEDGRIHTHFNQALTMTGRLSSTDPNLQNIPIRTERGARVRKAFVADKGQLLLSVDYSQIELRVLAHFSEDPNLIRAFVDDLDIHAATAAEVFGVKLADVTSEQRRAAKAVNFGIAYGQGAFGLAENLGISRTESAEIIKKYFTRFARVQNYIEETIAKARAQGYIETLSGRRRYMDELKSKNGAVQKFGERAAINAPIQGTASDLVKVAMIQVQQKIQIPMLLQVHDELIFEGPAEQVKKLEAKVVEIMESVAQLKVPLKANSAVGLNWDATK
jgi:DNA polymerase-1